MKKHVKNKEAGFSLVELMVVVGIIGILATIAVPNYLKFQAKAKQSNAKTELAGVYTAQKAFYVEYTSYTARMPQTGFVPEGARINAATNCPEAPAPLPAGTWAAGVNRSYLTGYSADFAAVGAPVPDALCQVFQYDVAGSGRVVDPIDAAAVTDQDTFIAESRGRLNNGTIDDVWQIDQNNVLQNTTQGF